MEPHHCILYGVFFADGFLAQHVLEVRDGDVTKEGAGGGVYNGEVGVVVGEGREEGV